MSLEDAIFKVFTHPGVEYSVYFSSTGLIDNPHGKVLRLTPVVNVDRTNCRFSFHSLKVTCKFAKSQLLYGDHTPSDYDELWNANMILNELALESGLPIDTVNEYFISVSHCLMTRLAGCFVGGIGFFQMSPDGEIHLLFSLQKTEVSP